MRFSKKAILEELTRLYPDAGPELNFTNPYETLVAVMLSAQCTDKMVNKVTPAVFARFPDAASMAAATVEELHPMVKSCGFKSKAVNIIETCKLLMLRHGGEVPRTMEELTALPGVGRKTANVVMSNAFGVPAIAVDTHVFRVSNRLGLAEADDVLKTELQLQKAIPKKDWLDMHHRLIFHGRRVCKAQRPLCAECTLREMCRAERERSKAAKNHKPHKRTGG
ncbi:MAG: endonuclease III [Clostridiales bacterium]|nr:endonuclease III [Clostridiales bacterium]